MDAKLHLANLLAQGHTIPEDAYVIEVEADSVDFLLEEPHIGANGYRTRYLSSIYFDNPRVAYDTYTMEFEGREFTVEEFHQWLAENPGILEKQAELQKSAMARLAELSQIVSEALVEGEKLAAEAGLPFVVNLGGSMQDVRKLAAVDWDSSSMYC
jgi:hypothetical protein